MNKTLIGIARLLALATCVSAAQPTPLNERQARPSPEWVTRGVMYQIQPRAFTPEGTLKAATARLPKVAELGVDIIYLCPVFVSDDDPNTKGWSPRQRKSGMNNPRNMYRMKDYYHVDPEYGTDDDLKAFIAEAHKLGMRVLLDMVYLHCGPNAVFLAEHPDFVKRDAEGKVAVAGWGFPALNLANPELREYLWRNMEYWVREFGADGFRCDVSDGIPLDFWETARERLDKIRPDHLHAGRGHSPRGSAQGLRPRLRLGVQVGQRGEPPEAMGEDAGRTASRRGPVHPLHRQPRHCQRLLRQPNREGMGNPPRQRRRWSRCSRSTGCR